MVTNLINERGNVVKNQFVVTNPNSGDIAFQSYKSRICEIRTKGGLGFSKVICFGRDWDYSTTTSKHLHSFLRQNNIYDLETKKDIENAIDKGYCKDVSVAVIYDPTMY